MVGEDNFLPPPPSVMHNVITIAKFDTGCWIVGLVFWICLILFLTFSIAKGLHYLQQINNILLTTPTHGL